jgi:hypothetical protein
MKLFLISQSENNDYDTYDSAVVAAPDEDTARKMHPYRGTEPPLKWEKLLGEYSDWAAPENVSVKCIGETRDDADERPRVICASFNAG